MTRVSLKCMEHNLAILAAILDMQMNQAKFAFFRGCQKQRYI